MVPTLLIQHDNLHPDQDQAIADTIQKIKDQGAPVLAILPGAETGNFVQKIVFISFSLFFPLSSFYWSSLNLIFLFSVSVRCGVS